MSFRAEYWAGTEEGTAMLVTPLSERVELLAAAWRTPVEICVCMCVCGVHVCGGVCVQYVCSK